MKTGESKMGKKLELHIVKLIKLFIPPIGVTIANKVINRELHRSTVGGMWDEIGKLQFEFMLKQGLKPGHKFLDIGCGSLRGGVHFIRYLNEGNYFGVDKEKWLLEAGIKIELPRYGLENKKVTLVQMDDFNFSRLGTKFDYALAQSVFTHLPWNSIMRCIVNVERVLKKGGKFYATFFENDKGKFYLDPIIHHPGRVTSYFDSDPYHYSFDVFVRLCEEISSLEVEYIGDWGHPRDQKMMVFKKV